MCIPSDNMCNLAPQCYSRTRTQQRHKTASIKVANNFICLLADLLMMKSMSGGNARKCVTKVHVLFPTTPTIVFECGRDAGKACQL